MPNQKEKKKPQGFEGRGDSIGPVSSGRELQEESTFPAKNLFPAPRNPVTF